MRILLIFVLGVASLSSIAAQTKSAPAYQLERFVGQWEIRKNPTTGRANLTLIFVRAGDKVSGTVNFVNPDGTSLQMSISHPEFKGTTLRRSSVYKTDFKGPTLEFQMVDHDAIMYWSLTLTSATTGFLRGDHHELLIEEHVRKKKYLKVNPLP